MSRRRRRRSGVARGGAVARLGMIETAVDGGFSYGRTAPGPKVLRTRERIGERMGWAGVAAGTRGWMAGVGGWRKEKGGGKPRSRPCLLWHWPQPQPRHASMCCENGHGTDTARTDTHTPPHQPGSRRRSTREGVAHTAGVGRCCAVAGRQLCVRACGGVVGGSDGLVAASAAPRTGVSSPRNHRDV